jgi:hypothetical protein
MNERTVELYKQATEFAYNSIGREHANTAYFQGAITGKFAQLIAQESIVDFYRRYLDICSEEDITVQVERYVKEHFGGKA